MNLEDPSTHPQTDKKNPVQIAKKWRDIKYWVHCELAKSDTVFSDARECYLAIAKTLLQATTSAQAKPSDEIKEEAQ